MTLTELHDGEVKPWQVRVCRDGTLTVARTGEPSFNDAALPCVHADTEEECKEAIVAFGKRQYVEHPLLPGQPWMRVWDFGGEVDDIFELGERMAQRFKKKVHP